MFRLAGFDDEKKDENGLYRYLSNAVSQTIITCLDGFLEDTERCRLFCDAFFGKEFFAGLSVYIKPKHSECIDRPHKNTPDRVCNTLSGSVLFSV